MIDYTEDFIHVEVSEIVSLPKEFFTKEQWDKLKSMDEEEILERIEPNTLDINLMCIERVGWSLKND